MKFLNTTGTLNSLIGVNFLLLVFLISLINFTTANESSTLLSETSDIEVYINGSANIGTILKKRDDINTDSSSINPFHEALLAVSSSVVVNSQAAANYEISLNRITNNASLVQRDQATVDWISGALTTYSVASGTVAAMAAFCRNQKQNDGFFSKTWHCVMLAQSIVVGATTSFAYLAYDGTISAGFEYIKGLANSNGSHINKRDFNNSSIAVEIPQYGWYNHSYIAHELALGGLTLDNVEYEYGTVGDDGFPYIYRPKYRLSLNDKPLVEISLHNGTFMTHLGDLGYLNNDGQDHDNNSAVNVKRDYVGEDEWNRVYFTQGGLLEEGCKYDGSSETLTMPKDLNMVYNLLDSFSGFWYYHSDKTTHWYIKDNNHNKDLAEGLLQRDTENFGYWQFTQPYNLCYGDGDWSG